MQRYQICATLS